MFGLAGMSSANARYDLTYYSVSEELPEKCPHVLASFGINCGCEDSFWHRNTQTLDLAVTLV